MSESAVTVCDNFFQLETKHFTCENIVQSIDLALRERGIIRGMNEQTIQTINKATLIVIQYMKKYLDEGEDEERAYRQALEIAIDKLNS
ncbi:MAG: hypothetical protein ACQESH_09260 [Campylobacterota bacterium]